MGIQREVDLSLQAPPITVQAKVLGKARNLDRNPEHHFVSLRSSTMEVRNVESGMERRSYFGEQIQSGGKGPVFRAGDPSSAW